MADAELAHVRTETEGTLGEGGADGRIELHDGDGATGHAMGRGDGVALGTEVGEAEADATTPFFDHGGVMGDLHDRLHVVFWRDDEAGTQRTLAILARVDEGGRVGQETQAGDQVIELLRPGLDFRFRGTDIAFTGGDGTRDTEEEALGVFNDLVVIIPREIALL